MKIEHIVIWAENKVKEWRVYANTEESRKRVGLK